MQLKKLFASLFIAVSFLIFANETAYDTTYSKDIISQLNDNGDINFWDDIITYHTQRDPDAQTILFFLERNNNPSKSIKLSVPSFFFNQNYQNICSHYLTTKLYNYIICYGANQVIVFTEDKEKEDLITKMISDSIENNYPRISTYGNYGDKINICNSSNFKIVLQKELLPTPKFPETPSSENLLIGIDIGGTNIKTIIMEGENIIEKFHITTDKEHGGKQLCEQLIQCVIKAKKIASKHNKPISAVGIAFPAPIKNFPDGSTEIIRLTNFERHWTHQGLTSFKKDYQALNNIKKNISKLGIPYVFILNDANAFGVSEICHRLWNTCHHDDKSPTIVLPVGTGPGYVKIDNNTIRHLPHQGGHLIIDLSPNACIDPGCEHRGCYGGYVPACAIALRAKQLKLDILENHDTLVPSNLNDVLSLLVDMSNWLAAEIIQLHKITNANEIILAGGICQNWTGKEIIRFTNDAIKEKYPKYANKIHIKLTSVDTLYGGAIGAAQYALAMKQANNPKWNYTYNLPKTTIGKNVIEEYFNENKTNNACLLTSTDLTKFMTEQGYPWFQELTARNAVFIVDKYPSPKELQEEILTKGYTSIINIGAGTVTDWSKFIGKNIKAEVISMPSALSGNGMFTEKAIFYLGNKEQRQRLSIFSGPPTETIIDLQFLQDLKNMQTTTGISSQRCLTSGSGDMVTIYSALLDWQLAHNEKKEFIDIDIFNYSKKLLDVISDNANEIKQINDLGLIILSETMAEASLLNMRYGTSRPKDGSEHLLADEMDRRLPDTTPSLHGEQVGLASIVMAYLYSSAYQPKAYLKIRKLVEALGLPIHPEDIGITKNIFIDAIKHISIRPDKYTFFDKFNNNMTQEVAEQAYERIFGNKSNEIADFTMDVSYYVNNSVKAMLEHLKGNVVDNIDFSQTKLLLDELQKTKKTGGRVIVNASGRIGEAAIFFLQKLRALGFYVDDFKEITPEFLVNKNDLILTLSGSGQTYSVITNLSNVDFLHRSGSLNRPIFSITASPEADCWQIGPSYHHIITLPGRAKTTCGKNSSEISEYLPLSSTFEYSSTLYLEGIVEALAQNASTLNEDIIPKIITNVIWETTVNCQKEIQERLYHNELITAEFVNILMSTLQQEKGNEPLIKSKNRIYFFGLGQNNYVIRLFARRMQNIGFDVYVPGPRDIVSKPRPGDIAIFVSNSGARGQMIEKMIMTKETPCPTILITAAPHSPLASLADLVIPITRRTTVSHTADIMLNNEECHGERAIKRGFEIASMFYFEGISVALMKLLNITENDLQHIPKQFE